MDLVFAVHLQGLRVWLGDGKGHFTNSSEGLPLTNFPTRRVVVADFDQDGWPDVMAISEGPTAADKNVTYGKAVAFLNRNKGAQWSALPASDPKAVFAGDWLAVGLDPRPERLAAFPWRGGPGAPAAPPTLETLVGRLADLGVRRFVLSHGGARPDPALLSSIVSTIDADVLVAGGVTDLAGIHALRDAGVYGVILGEPLLSGAIDYTAALEAAA